MLNSQSKIMKKVLIGALLTFTATTALADSVIVNGTRFIYSSNEKEITVKLTNNANRPALVQTWLDEGDPSVSPDKIITPFTITPPIAKIGPKSGQSIRIKGTNKGMIPMDKESIWFLNVLEIPPSNVAPEQADKNLLQLAFRSRFKFIYRPVNLGEREKAVEQIRLSGKGKMLKIENPTPFFITITSISKDSKTDLLKDSVMVSPKSNQNVSLMSDIHTDEELHLVELNDYGTSVKFKKIVK